MEDVRKENRFCVQRFITPKACSLGLGVVGLVGVVDVDVGGGGGGGGGGCGGWVWWVWWWCGVVGVVVVGEGVVGRRTRISPILFFTDMCNIHGIQNIYSSLDGAFLST